MSWYKRQRQLYDNKQQSGEELQPKQQPAEPGVEKKESKMEENRGYEGATQTKDTVSLIGEHTKLAGDISTDDDLTIYGIVVGNIQCSRSVKIYGSVEGDIICQDAVIYEASVHGNIECKDTLKISQQSEIEGGITTAILENGGHIHGDVKASGHISLSSESQILGDISAQTISVDQGACIQGCVMIGKYEENNH